MRQQRAAFTSAVSVIALLLFAVPGCTITPPSESIAATSQPVVSQSIAAPTKRQDIAALEQYRIRVARRILERNPSLVLHGTPQAMLRSVVVVTFTVDSEGMISSSAVYRTNGDPGAERVALAALHRASPLPQPPTDLLDARGHLELMEDWLFNNNGKFQLHEFASPQAKTIP
ncbi:energy transducer TonB (plasmid) [Burkholderia sp. PAMC 28687]|uniref:energy transducer TonB family protein n=1 Tax=Burkholderia sp. PAMC 28687 TaxID=1795874 RepID=UPI000785C714|nr:energy transducer TonB [Burkholderia sp. PAMC 28687]AMM18626.1 energy transducer TonB [Burkholderia sp. PAMC 28687]